MSANRLGQWDELAEALRGELAEYGGLLSLLEEQRAAIVSRRTDQLNDVNERVQAEMASAVRCKDVREKVCLRLARACGAPDNATVRELIGYMPPASRGMFEALMKAATGVTERVGDKVRRNSLLVARASEVNEKLIMGTRPQSTTKAYNNRGSVYLKTSRSGALDLTA